MVFKCVSHYSLLKDVEESGGEQTSLANSSCGSEPFSNVVVMVDCAGRLVVEALYGSDQVVIDVIQPHGSLQRPQLLLLLLLLLHWYFNHWCVSYSFFLEKHWWPTPVRPHNYYCYYCYHCSCQAIIQTASASTVNATSRSPWSPLLLLLLLLLSVVFSTYRSWWIIIKCRPLCHSV